MRTYILTLCFFFAFAISSLYSQEDTTLSFKDSTIRSYGVQVLKHHIKSYKYLIKINKLESLLKDQALTEDGKKDSQVSHKIGKKYNSLYEKRYAHYRMGLNYLCCLFLSLQEAKIKERNTQNLCRQMSEGKAQVSQKEISKAFQEIHESYRKGERSFYASISPEVISKREEIQSQEEALFLSEKEENLPLIKDNRVKLISLYQEVKFLLKKLKDDLQISPQWAKPTLHVSKPWYASLWRWVNSF